MKMEQSKRIKDSIFFIVVMVLVIVGCIVSICVGQYSISLEEIGAMIIGADTPEMTKKVFFHLRVPRTLMAMIAGVGLGISGYIYQTIFKNPLASPDIVGVSPGANLGAAIAIVLLGGSTLAIAGGAFIGGIVVVSFVILIVKKAPTNITITYVLAGIIMSHISKALIMLMKFFADPMNELAVIEFWTMGSLANVTSRKLLTVFPLFLIALLMLCILHRQIDLLMLNEDECQMLGVHVTRIRTIILVFSTLLVASIISITGLISFVGLISPHVAKMLLKKTGFSTAIMSAMIGSVILLFSDTLARSLYSAEIPISILTTILGVPILVYFLLKQREFLS